jgi:hypothetical protein
VVTTLSFGWTWAQEEFPGRQKGRRKKRKKIEARVSPRRAAHLFSIKSIIRLKGLDLSKSQKFHDIIIFYRFRRIVSRKFAPPRFFSLGFRLSASIRNYGNVS